MIALILIYLALIFIFGVTGVFVWILRGRGFSDFRRPRVERPPTEDDRGTR